MKKSKSSEARGTSTERTVTEEGTSSSLSLTPSSFQSAQPGNDEVVTADTSEPQNQPEPIQVQTTNELQDPLFTRTLS